MTDQVGRPDANVLREERVVLHCSACGIALSRPLHAPCDPKQFQHEDGVSSLPHGYYALSNDVIKDEEFYGVLDDEVLTRIDDLIGVTECGKRNGCCGPDGMDGMNLSCSNHHEIGTEVGDCWTPHFVHLPLSRVSMVAERNGG